MATPEHQDGVRALGAEGWRVPGPKRQRSLTKDIAMMLACWHHGSWWRETPERCAALWAGVPPGWWPVKGPYEPLPDAEEDSPPLAHIASQHFDDLRRYRNVPDAWRWTFAQHPGGCYPCLWIAEVNVTSHADLAKWLDLWVYVEEGEEFDFRYVVIDRNGVRSEPWTFQQALDLWTLGPSRLRPGFAERLIARPSPRSPLSRIDSGPPRLAHSDPPVRS